MHLLIDMMNSEVGICMVGEAGTAAYLFLSDKSMKSFTEAGSDVPSTLFVLPDRFMQQLGQ